MLLAATSRYETPDSVVPRRSVAADAPRRLVVRDAGADQMACWVRMVDRTIRITRNTAYRREDRSVAVEVGATAPDFTLRDQNNEEVTLSEFRGHRAVVLLFYPLTFTGICQGELCAVRDDISSFQNPGVQVLAVSVDSPYAHKVWADREGYDFPLLADFWPHGAVARSYGVLEEGKGFAVRATFIIDKDGIVRWKVVNGPGEARDHTEYLKALATL
jgi:peroxiredoxin